MVKEIILTQGKVALVDDEDYELIRHYKWRVQKAKRTCYARTNLSGKKPQKVILMHRFILNASGDEKVDHEDHNGLNNQRYNIRLGNKQQNHFNTQKHLNRKGKPLSSEYKGVYRDRHSWRASIKVNGKTVYLGVFKDEIDAANAYDEAAKVHFGEFALLNFN